MKHGPGRPRVQIKPTVNRHNSTSLGLEVNRTSFPPHICGSTIAQTLASQLNDSWVSNLGTPNIIIEPFDPRAFPPEITLQVSQRYPGYSGTARVQGKRALRRPPEQSKKTQYHQAKTKQNYTHCKASARVNSVRVFNLQAGGVVGEVDCGLVHPRRLASSEGKQLVRVDVLGRKF